MYWEKMAINGYYQNISSGWIVYRIPVQPLHRVDALQISPFSFRLTNPPFVTMM